MAFQFTNKDLEEIEKILGASFHDEDGVKRMVLDNKDEGRKLSLEIYSDIQIGERKGNLLSVYTASTHLQLHFCTGYVASDMLGEITFIGESGGKISGLIIEKGAGCSLYANVDANILSGDFTQLGPEVMLSSIALSLTENLLNETSE